MNQKEKSQPGPVAIKYSGWAGTVVAATLQMLHEERLCYGNGWFGNNPNFVIASDSVAIS